MMGLNMHPDQYIDIYVGVCMYYRIETKDERISTAQHVHDAHLGEDKLALEGFPLTFASPDTQDQGNLQMDIY